MDRISVPHRVLFCGPCHQWQSYMRSSFALSGSPCFSVICVISTASEALHGKNAVDWSAIAGSGRGHSDNVVEPTIAGITGLELRRRTEVIAPSAFPNVGFFKISRILGIFRCRPESPLPIDIEQSVAVRFQAETHIQSARTF